MSWSEHGRQRGQLRYQYRARDDMEVRAFVGVEIDDVKGTCSQSCGTSMKVAGDKVQPTALHYDLAHRILQYARWSDLPVGAHLREAELAERFQVSRSPIRGAFKLLGERRIVRHAPHYGVFLRIAGRDLGPDMIGNKRVPEQELFHRVVHDRLAGVLPDILSAAELGRLYEVNRTRLTRLLNDMANEGLVERLPGQRWRFNPALTSEEIYDSSYRFRMIIEPATFLEPGFSADESELAELISVHTRLIEGEVWSTSYSDLYQFDAVFHESVARWSGNEFLVRAVRNQNRLRRLTEYEYYADRNRMLASCREHASILEAVRDGQIGRASALMRSHIESSWQSRPSFPVKQTSDGCAGSGTKQEV